MNLKYLKHTPILFEFKGDISKNCRRYLLRKLSVRTCLTILALLIVTMPITLLLISGVLDGEVDAAYLWSICPVLGAICLLASVLGMIIPYTKLEQKELFPIRICFYNDEDNTVVVETVKEKKIEYSDLFRKIVDMGDFYYIDIPARSGRGYICEKALMIQGTVEEFEKKFEGKIVRGNQKK